MKLSKKICQRVANNHTRWKKDKTMQHENQAYPGSFREPTPPYTLCNCGGNPYQESIVIKELKDKGISFNNKEIDISRRYNCGNRSFGKIDFLVNYCNYRITKR